MTSQKGRDFLLKIGNGADPESFTALGAARTNAMSVNNSPVDNTTMDNGGVQALMSDAGVQTMQFNIDGLFKDTAAEEILRTASMDRMAHNFQLAFPNGDVLEASFPDFKLINVKYNALTVQGELTIEDFSAEPYPSGQFSPADFPSLF